MLRDHQHEREVVHPQGGVEQPIRIDEEDDVLDGVFDKLGLALYRYREPSVCTSQWKELTS